LRKSLQFLCKISKPLFTGFLCTFYFPFFINFHRIRVVLRWMMDNIFIRRDPAGNIKPDKEKSTEKIDGAVAMIMALDRAIRCGCVSDESVYDTREMLVL